MEIAQFDWIIIISFLFLTLLIGAFVAKKSGILTIIALIAAYLLSKVWSRIKVDVL